MGRKSRERRERIRAGIETPIGLTDAQKAALSELNARAVSDPIGLFADLMSETELESASSKNFMAVTKVLGKGV